MFPLGDPLHHYVVHSSILHCYFKTHFISKYTSVSTYQKNWATVPASVHKSNQPSFSVLKAHFDRNFCLLAVHPQTKATMQNVVIVCLRPL